MPVLTPDQKIGMRSFNEQIRYIVSPPGSFWGNEQRAEFIRIIASQYGTSDRYARLWFTLGQQSRPFLVATQPDDEWVGRVILCKCLILQDQLEDGARSQWVLVQGVTANLLGRPLRELIEEPFPGDGLFHWNFNGHTWNLQSGETRDDRISFYLHNTYQASLAPWWVPSDLKPVSGIDFEPF